MLLGANFSSLELHDRHRQPPRRRHSPSGGRQREESVIQCAANQGSALVISSCCCRIGQKYSESSLVSRCYLSPSARMPLLHTRSIANAHCHSTRRGRRYREPCDARAARARRSRGNVRVRRIDPGETARPQHGDQSRWPPMPNADSLHGAPGCLERISAERVQLWLRANGVRWCWRGSR